MKLLSISAMLVLVAIGATGARSGAAGDNAIIMDVSNVRLPDRLPGVCRVSGVINEVLSGTAYRDGQAISLQVPCGIHTRPMPLLPAVETRDEQLIDPQVLMASKVGGAHIDNAGNLIWEPTRPHGHWGAIWGYRVLEGVRLYLDRPA